MPLLFLIVGVLFLVASVRGQDEVNELVGVMKDDFTGPKNFFAWALAVGFVAGLQYIPKMRPLSNVLLVLVFLALILSHSDKSGNNFITKFFNQIRDTEK